MIRTPWLLTGLNAGSAALLLASCAADTNAYPSLARRPAERMTGSAEPVAASGAVAPMPDPPSPTLSARLERLLDQAQTAHRRFAAQRGAAERLVSAASGAAVASESWSVASIALADLESERSAVMIALADLDALYAADQTAGTANGDSAAIASARETVMRLVGEEDAALNALRGRLRS